MVRTPRNAHWRPVCWTSCKFTKSLCCLVVAVGCSTVLPSRVELEIVRVIDTPEATHIRYRVRR
jgi:hypothetical protein